ncbi:MAG: hypothetical protein H6642_10450 [Caldilineaceae bacterium]|nr:hypothetical protein [Caldilineaceae bacterium]
MVLKTFDDLPALAAAFDGTVFQDIGDDTLFVYDKLHHQWHQYRWAPGKREIVYLGPSSGELPLVTQAYP